MADMSSDSLESFKNIAAEQAGIFDFDAETASLRGDLSVVTIDNLMHLMSHAQLSGDLYLQSPNNAACFIVRNGELVFSYLKFNFARIGERLFEAGHITNEDLRECLRLYREKGGKLRLGEILVTKNFVSSETLEEIIREQVKDCFFKVLRWKKGAFSFFVNELPPDEDVQLHERIDYLVLEGIVAMERDSET